MAGEEPKRRLLVVGEAGVWKGAVDGAEVVESPSLEQAWSLTQREHFDLLILPEEAANPSLGEVLGGLRHLRVCVVSGEPALERAVQAMRAGAAYYCGLPGSPDEARECVAKALEPAGWQSPSHTQPVEPLPGLVGTSPGMQEVYRLVRKVAKTDSTVLITGESGTGKELVARAIHALSDRALGPMVPVNCGAIPEDLLESELFGHEKGAFTGAVRSRPGRFELAQGGTIFLDEVGEMSPKLQVKLLRVLQERAFERVGGVRTITVDIRVVAATNQDLLRRVEEGSFREDLFYRLNVFPIHIPPLRERKGDIPLLCEHFLAQLARRKGMERKRLHPEVLELLVRYHWPGNVRELENLLERMVILADGEEITPADLPPRIASLAPAAGASPAARGVGAAERSLILGGDLPPAQPAPVLPEEGIDFNKAVDAFERSLIIQALERTGWVKNRAAALLRLNRTTLVEKIKKKGIRPPDQE